MFDINEFTRFYLAIFYSSVAAFYTLRILLMKQANSQEFVFSGKRFCKTWLNHTTFRLFRVAIWMVCVLRLFFPTTDSYLGMIESLNKPPIIVLGLVLLSLGFLSTILIHFHLGKHWRSGIDPSGPKHLITTGIFQYSRNPMYIFVAIAQLGFFLALPSLFTLVCLGIGLYTLDSQAREEEKHLSDKFLESYEQYAAKVNRWI